MKLPITILLLALFAVLGLAATPQKDVIVSYPNDTPSSVVDDAKNAIVKAGGVIEHEYTLIKGFVAKVSAKTLDEVKALGSQHNVLIEEDQTVHANGS
ncbi:hypothetical protein LTR85_006620 [Meristemomyces frigidus]|nr:hypothetical protein LTR85_006620 [Meristemomyces frigidus]